jgi:Leucine-rich repeat (LRR) protein
MAKSVRITNLLWVASVSILSALAVPAVASDFAISPTFDTAFRWSVQAGGNPAQINPSLQLHRGLSYSIDVNASAMHPFWINTVDTTGSGAAYAGTGLSANGVNSPATITFVVPSDAPNQLFYNCGNHSTMSGVIEISGTIPSSERAALDQLFVSTSGVQWYNGVTGNDAWGGPVGSECSWFGITCETDPADPSVDHVVGILLNDNNLGGPLPALDGFSHLKSFVVGDNPITGNLPQLTTVPSIEVFVADYAQISGSIPSLSGLKNLKDFMVGYNQLTGQIPDLSDLPSLQYFDIQNNLIGGNIPSLAALTQLQIFYANNNALTGTIPSIAGLSNLQSVYLNDNQLGGSIPPLAGVGADNLAAFYVDNNQLTGTFPSPAGLPNLVGLGAGFNKLTGTMPDLGGAPNLKYVFANDNLLSGQIPPLTLLKELVALDVANNQLTGSIPSLTGLTKLADFVVSRNQLTGSIPSLTGLGALEQFHVGYNQLTGSVPLLPVVLINATLCPNLISTVPQPAIDPSWNQATGSTPWWATPFATNQCDELFFDPFGS